MRVKELKLVHYRGAKELELAFEPGVNLLVGVNGSGKTTILDALATALSWVPARIRSHQSSGSRIKEKDIHNEKDFSWFEILCANGNSTAVQDELHWRIVSTRAGRNPETDPNDALRGVTKLSALNEWAHRIRDELGQKKDEVNLPLFAYYPVNRAVIDVPLRIRIKHSFDLLSGYDGSLTSGVNFRIFFEWYRNREDIENERYRENPSLQNDPQLDAVRRAIMVFQPGISKIFIRRKSPSMRVVKDGKEFAMEQLSDGEKCLFALVGDLARRLATLNPLKENPLEGEGVVLIDEIDLHLHPQWQRDVVGRLSKTFPNCQFILTTHSPQVYGETEPNCIHILDNSSSMHGLKTIKPDQSFGLDASSILEQYMSAKSRNSEINAQIEELSKIIDEEKFTEAKQKIKTIEERLGGSIPETIHAKSMIFMLEDEKD